MEAMSGFPEGFSQLGKSFCPVADARNFSLSPPFLTP
jgi:hypothetical protein